MQNTLELVMEHIFVVSKQIVKIVMRQSLVFLNKKEVPTGFKEEGETTAILQKGYPYGIKNR